MNYDPEETRADLRSDLIEHNGYLKKSGYYFTKTINPLLIDTGPPGDQIPKLKNQIQRMRNVFDRQQHVPVPARRAAPPAQARPPLPPPTPPSMLVKHSAQSSDICTTIIYSFAINI